MIAADSHRTSFVKRIATCSALVIASIVGATGVANADTRAEALFREGRALLDAKRYADACPKLAESQALEPGAGTLLALALCHEGQGKTATARAELLEAASLGRRVGRNELANAADKRAKAMEGSLSKINIAMPHDAPSDYEVKVDGDAVGADKLGKPFAVDPGEHRVDVSAKGKVTRHYPLVIAGAGLTEVNVELLEDASPAAPPPAPVPASKRAPERVQIDPASLETASAPHDEHRGGAQRAIGLGVAGLGVAGVGVGVYFGVRAAQLKSEARNTCSSSPCNDAAAADANARAKTALNMSMLSIAASTAAIGLGTVLFITAPKADPKMTAANGRVTARLVPAAGPGQAGLDVVGSF